MPTSSIWYGGTERHSVSRPAIAPAISRDWVSMRPPGSFGRIFAPVSKPLLRRLKNPVLLDDKSQWRENAGLRGSTRLRIAFVPQPSSRAENEL
jgi:hypothetical protein